MEAAQGLHGYRGKESGMTSKKADAKDGKVFRQWEGKKGDDGGVGEDEVEGGVEVELLNAQVVAEESCVDVKGAVGKFESGEKTESTETGAGGNTKEQSESEPQPVEEKVDTVQEKEPEQPEALPVEEKSTGEEEKAVEDLKTTDNNDDAPADEKKEQTSEEKAQEQPVEEPVVQEPVPEPPKQEPTPQPEPTPKPEPTVQEPPAPIPKPPTYSKTDVKFSFGLIVRSNHPTGKFDENLRDNETLRKCMASTSKILIREMPSPPEINETTTTSTPATPMDYDAFPKAYYDPTLEPTVLSIEEDTKDNEIMMEKGNKRTLVKASFPVFLRDVEGSEKSKALLKETKSTVFKALRAAVSGGQFLR